jgi:hypothetical protein
MWHFQLMLATLFGCYKATGVWWMGENPKGQVQYADGISHPMALGNAVEYAEMFKGKVVKPKEKR